MTHVEDLSQRSPEEIESRIAHTRKSLDHKLERLGERLDPGTRLAEVKEEVAATVDRVKGQVSSRAPQIYAWSAVGAVAAGAAMAASGWRRLHQNEDMYLCGCVADTMESEPLGDGVVSGPTIEPRL
jgi:uncharacterized protein DUF3618